MVRSDLNRETRGEENLQEGVHNVVVLRSDTGVPPEGVGGSGVPTLEVSSVRELMTSRLRGQS